MRTGARLVTALLLVSALLPTVVPTVVSAQRTSRMYTVRLDGYVGQPPEDRREMADLRLRAAGDDVRFQLTSARMMTGSISIQSFLSRVRPYSPNLILRGPKDQLARVAHAPRGAVLRITGSWRPGSQDLLVQSVERK